MVNMRLVTDINGYASRTGSSYHTSHQNQTVQDGITCTARYQAGGLRYMICSLTPVGVTTKISPFVSCVCKVDPGQEGGGLDTG